MKTIFVIFAVVSFLALSVCVGVYIYNIYFAKNSVAGVGTVSAIVPKKFGKGFAPVVVFKDGSKKLHKAQAAVFSDKVNIAVGGKVFIRYRVSNLGRKTSDVRICGPGGIGVRKAKKTMLIFGGIALAVLVLCLLGIIFF